jgi:hypothetical protein
MKLDDEDIYNFISCAGDLNKLGAQLIDCVKNSDKEIPNNVHKDVGDVFYSLWLLVDAKLNEEKVKDQITIRVKRGE